MCRPSRNDCARESPRFVGAIRVGDFKLIVGQVDAGWGPRPDTGDTAVAAPGETGPWIFNVRTDASERVNLHDSPAHADVRKRLYAALARYNASAVPCRLCYAKPDPAAAPAVGDDDVARINSHASAVT